MANSIDWGTLAVGALIGVGCKKQLKAASRIAASTAASLAGVAAATAQQVAQQAAESPEKQAAQAWLQRVDQNIAAGQAPAQGNGKDH